MFIAVLKLPDKRGIIPSKPHFAFLFLQAIDHIFFRQIFTCQFFFIIAQVHAVGGLCDDTLFLQFFYEGFTGLLGWAFRPQPQQPIRYQPFKVSWVKNVQKVYPFRDRVLRSWHLSERHLIRRIESLYIAHAVPDRYSLISADKGIRPMAGVQLPFALRARTFLPRNPHPRRPSIQDKSHLLTVCTDIELRIILKITCILYLNSIAAGNLMRQLSPYMLFDLRSFQVHSDQLTVNSQK